MRVRNEKLINRRLEQGLTQVEVALKVNVSLRAYQKYENEGQTPNARTAVLIAKVLGTTVEKLWGL